MSQILHLYDHCFFFCVNSDVPLQMARSGESLSTNIALMRSFSSVPKHVLFQITTPTALFITDLTFILSGVLICVLPQQFCFRKCHVTNITLIYTRFFSCVNTNVHLHMARILESLSTNITLIRSFFCVRKHVILQIPALWESFLADFTFIFSYVQKFVSSQTNCMRKRHLANITFFRFFTCVQCPVSLQASKTTEVFHTDITFKFLLVAVHVLCHNARKIKLLVTNLTLIRLFS